MPDIAVCPSSMTAGACGEPPVPATSGSSTVYVDGQKVMCVGDSFEPHLHPVIIAQGSSIVSIDGKPAAYVGCACGCGDVIASGSSTVNIQS